MSLIIKFLLLTVLLAEITECASQVAESDYGVIQVSEIKPEVDSAPILSRAKRSPKIIKKIIDATKWTTNLKLRKKAFKKRLIFKYPLVFKGALFHPKILKVLKIAGGKVALLAVPLIAGGFAIGGLAGGKGGGKGGGGYTTRKPYTPYGVNLPGPVPSPYYNTNFNTYPQYRTVQAIPRRQYYN